MIFVVKNHIEQVVNGTKTQTRRIAKPNSFIYKVGHTYSIQPCRTCKGIKEGRILIQKCMLELRQDIISVEDALSEGGYTVTEYETLFIKINGDWRSRYAYKFNFIPKEDKQE